VSKFQFQAEAVKEPGRKRLKLEEVDQSFICSTANEGNKSTVRGWDCVEPKQDSDSSDLNALISFAIVKDEVDDEDSFKDTVSDSKILPAKINLEADASGDLSEMTVSVVTCKEREEM
jgi:hypothetical protein